MLKRAQNAGSTIRDFLSASPTATTTKQKARQARYRTVLRASMEHIAPGQALPCEGQARAADWKPRRDLVMENPDDVASMSPEEMFVTANALFMGSHDVKEDKKAAFHLWKKAADCGHLHASYSCAGALRRGEGTGADPKQALSIFERLAKESLPQAQYALAQMLSSGEAEALGARKDDRRVRKLFMSAAEAGFAPAIHNTACMLAQGIGGEKDEQRAAKLYEVAADLGDAGSCFNLGTWYIAGRGGLEVNKKKGFALTLIAAQMGLPAAVHNVGVFFFRGIGVEKDLAKAARWFEVGADAGIPMSMSNLAIMYIKGYGVEVDISRARKLCAQSLNLDGASEKGDNPQHDIALDKLLQILEKSSEEDLHNVLAAQDKEGRKSDSNHLNSEQSRSR